MSLPFKQAEEGKPELELGYSRPGAVRSQVSNERKFARNQPFAVLYRDFVQEYIDLGHLVKVDEALIHRIPNSQKYYLPHLAVEKESTTTKLRVVLNGSAKTSTGVSLNDKIAVGPTLQDQLICHILRFRMHKIALSGDVSKMYRQVLLNEEARKFHLFLWRDTPDEPISCYEMTRVTYGITSSCYHAVRALQETAKNSNAPIAVKNAAQRDFYVDDIMTGAPTVEDARDLLHGLIDLFKSKGFLIRKWASNIPELITELDVELRENADAFDVFADTHEEHTLKTLGIRWKPMLDIFFFAVNHLEQQGQEVSCHTKRELLADILKLFDPMGWLSPVTLKLKEFMQSTWAKGLGWDEALDDETRDGFLAWRAHLPALRKLQIPRCVLAEGETKEIQLHVFCDASETGYAACIYTRVVDENGTSNVQLLFAKAKVAPVKQMSIPRLELMAAQLGTQILTIAQTSLESIGVIPTKVFGYSDSTTVLAWLAGSSKNWNTFVANRVSEIQSTLPRQYWFHVKTDENPADVASRGIFPEELEGNKGWWHGPHWLGDNFETPDQSHLDNVTTAEAKKAPMVCLFGNQTGGGKPFMDLNDTSDIERTVRVTVYVIRFAAAFKQSQGSSEKGCLSKYRAQFSTPSARYATPAEQTFVRNLFIEREQQEYYGSEIELLQQGKTLPKKHHLRKLYPFVDNGLLKVGGRLHASDLTEEQRYQIIVPKEGNLARLLVSQVHKKLMHGTHQGCLAALHTKYWVVGAKSIIKKHIRECVKCFRYMAQKPQMPLMGDLPKERVTPSCAFDHTGVDFAGPFTVREYVKGKATEGKAYLALFVCFASKAVHLEAVGSLSGPSCIAALRRFVARRGTPLQIYSDNGTNFVGSRNELDKLQEALDKTRGKDSMPNAAAQQGTNWVHIPPRAPHFGGLWESAIKSAKTHLKKTMGKNVFTYEELSTVFSIVESIMNSRPLVELSSDDSDFTALTPAMIVTGKVIRHLPLDAAKEMPTLPAKIDLHPAKRWSHINKIAAHFWHRWTREYLPTLQVRKKWQVETPNFQPKDMVLVAKTFSSHCNGQSHASYLSTQVTTESYVLPR